MSRSYKGKFMRLVTFFLVLYAIIKVFLLINDFKAFQVDNKHGWEF